jgi:hypothetical protein
MHARKGKTDEECMESGGIRNAVCSNLVIFISY